MWRTSIPSAAFMREFIKIIDRGATVLVGYALELMGFLVVIDVAIVLNAGSLVSWDEDYWQKVANSNGGTRVEKTIKVTVLLKLMLVAVLAMIFAHGNVGTIMRLFDGPGFRFKNQGMIRGFRI